MTHVLKPPTPCGVTLSPDMSRLSYRHEAELLLSGPSSALREYLDNNEVFPKVDRLGFPLVVNRVAFSTDRTGAVTACVEFYSTMIESTEFGGRTKFELLSMSGMLSAPS